MIGVLYALTAAIAYGVSDFVGGLASRHVAALRVVIVSYPLALIVLLVMALSTGGTVTAPAVLWGVACGVSQGLAIWWFYAALGSGPISVISPLTAILAAGLPLGVGLVLGERPGLIAGVGAVMALVAVVLVSREATDEDVRPHRFTRSVAWLTAGAGMGFGLNFVLLAQAPHEARLWPLVFGRTMATVIVVVAAVLTRNLSLPQGIPMKLALTAAAFDVTANVTQLLALQASMLSLA
ncbi:MAG: EamA family transporter, partial [Mycobacterium sp.]